MGRQLTWAWLQADEDAPSPQVKAALAREKVTDWYAEQPFRKGLNPLSVAPEYEAYYLDEQNHADYDAYCTAAGLAPAERYATWDGGRFTPGGDYAVSVHRPA